MAPKSSIVLASGLVLLAASAAMAIGGITSSETVREASSFHEESGKGGLLGNLAGGPLDILGLGKKPEQKQEQKLGGGLLGGNLLGGGLLGEQKKGVELGEKKEAGKEAAFLGAKNPGELVKLLFNPLELIKQITSFFKIEKLPFFDVISRGLTFGIEVALQPALISIKIIEKVFTPDVCTLKFVCELGKPLQAFRGAMPKFSPHLFDGSSNLKALNDGVHGHECEHLYPCAGELKLKKEFAELKNPLLNGGGGANKVESFARAAEGHHPEIHHVLGHHNEGAHHGEAHHAEALFGQVHHGEGHHDEGHHGEGHHGEGHHDEGVHHGGEGHFGEEHHGEHAFAGVH